MMPRTEYMDQFMSCQINTCLNPVSDCERFAHEIKSFTRIHFCYVNGGNEIAKVDASRGSNCVVVEQYGRTHRRRWIDRREGDAQREIQRR